MPKKGNQKQPDIPDPKNRLKMVFEKFFRKENFVLRRGAKSDMDIVKEQLRSQYSAHVRDYPRLSDNEKLRLKCAISVGQVATQSRLLKNLTNKIKYIERLTDAVYELAMGKVDASKEIEKEIAQRLDIERDYVNTLVQQAFGIYYNVFIKQ